MTDHPAPRLLIAGEWLDAAGRETIPVMDPATGDVLTHLPVASRADVDRAAEAAAASFPAWRDRPVIERSAMLRRAAVLMRERSEAVAVTLTREQGKPLAQSRSELAASADVFDFYAEEMRRTFGRIIPSRNASTRLDVLREPVGPVAAFTPWNFPASQAARKLAPALAAGCTCVIKGAEETPGAVVAMVEALVDAGLPDGVLNLVFGVPHEVSQQLIAHPAIRKISFTGSTAIGKLIARQAADHVKRVTLELGGHAPVLVCDDADAEQAGRLGAVAKFRNAGQVCIAPTRFLVQDKVHDRFVTAFAGAMAKMRVGNGLDPATDMGPLANGRRDEAIGALTDDAIAAGARLVAGGTRLSNAGNFRAPTLLADVPIDCRAMNEEPFGPLALIRRFDSLDEAVEEANRLPYGLAAYAFTRDRERIARLRREIESGMIGINGFAISWPETPFGGVKESGYGSEGGSEGLDAYLSTKFVAEA
jgi:succinate-semialdehyde dehydrogenase/glutarate-semialdehyde dehydrogenase